MKSLQAKYPWLNSHLKRSKLLLEGVKTTTGEDAFQRNLRLVRKVIEALPDPNHKEQRDVVIAAAYYGVPKDKLKAVPSVVKPIVESTSKVRQMILQHKPEKEVLEELVVHRGAPLIETLAMADAMENLEKEPAHLKETLARYALFVHSTVARHGLYDAHKKIEENAFKYLYPKHYNEIKKDIEDMYKINWVQNSIGTAQVVAKDILNQMNEKAKKNNQLIEYEIQGPEVKSIPSIHYKLEEYRNSSEEKKKNIKYAYELPDIIRMRVIIEKNDPKLLYEFLQRLQKHEGVSEVTDVEDRLGPRKKPNGYESLHAIIKFKNPEAHPIELQIRTRKMHEVAEKGKASHYLYKTEKTRALPSGEIKRLPVMPREFFDEIKKKLGVSEAHLSKQAVVLNQVRVNGKLHLICDAPIVEAAVLHYGEKVKDMFPLAAKINGKPAPLSARIKDGDEIEFYRDTKNGKMVPIDAPLVQETRKLITKYNLWEKKGAKRKAAERKIK
ncbi:MAG: hypothetical protein ACP5IG_01325 [Candidatus Micrarchaeia archaeon]